MADIEKAYEIGGGGILITTADLRIVWIGGGVTDPSVTGQIAPLGSVYYQTNGKQLTKTGPLPTDWTEIFANIFSGVTPPQILSHNGRLTDGQLVGMTNVVNNPLVVGFRSRIVKVTYYNRRAGSDGDLRIYKGLENPSNLFHTISFVNKTTFVENITTSPIFEIGDLCRIYYDDTGLNPRDMTLGLYFEAVPI